jgi:hypothetical protein
LFIKRNCFLFRLLNETVDETVLFRHRFSRLTPLAS